jgi:signal transduction histidine kinase
VSSSGKRLSSEASAPRGPDGATIIAALSEVAAKVQKQRTVTDVLETAGLGILALGMRLYAFELIAGDLVLRYIAASSPRVIAVEQHIGRPLRGVRAPLAGMPLAHDTVRDGRILHRDDLDVLTPFLKLAARFDLTTLDRSCEAPSANAGVLAPIFVREETWGLLGVASSTLTRDDADAVALFAMHVGTAIEVAESIEALERTNRELAACYVDLARAQKDLVERERLAALGELAAVVAHEVRNPLCVLFNSIGGLREFLRTGAPDDKLADAEAFATMADEEANHLNRIVSDLLEFARPHPPDLRPASILPVLEAVAATTAPDGRVCVELAAGLPGVHIDARFIQQAILNLVLNGLQAIAKDGTVTVRALVEESAVTGRRLVRIDVIDDGLGIPADVRASIFEPFFTTKASGTGLGLAVVKRIVDSHGGTLAVESGERGTTFTLRLPALAAG